MEVGKVEAGLYLNDKSFEAGMGRAEGKLTSINSKLESVSEKTRDVGTSLTAGITLPLVGVAAGILKLSGDFEQSMANAGAVSGATAEQLDRMKLMAREAGATTSFSASQAADAMYYMASAGWDVNQMGAALVPVLDLAAATDTDLAKTTDIVVATLNQYSLGAEGASRVTNTFAAAIGGSQATMEKLSSSFTQVGSVAGSFGWTIEETTGALMGLYDKGTKAETAGTALRNIIALLGNSASTSNKKLKELGISFDEINPATHSLADIIDVLTEKGLTSAQMLDIFGNEAGTEMINYMAMGGDAIREYTATVTDTNAAHEMAVKMLATLWGQLNQVSSAAQEVALKFGDVLMPTITSLVSNHILPFVQGLSKLDSNIIKIIAVAGLAAAALGPVLIAVSMMIPALGLLASPLFLAAAGLTAVVLAAKGMPKDLGKAFNKIRPTLEKIWKKVTGEAVRSWEKLSDLGSKIGSWILGYNWSGLWASVVGLAQQGWDRLGDLGTDLAWDIKGYNWGALWSRITDIAITGWDKLNDIGSRVGGWFEGYDWAGLWSRIIDVAGQGWDALKGLGSKVGGWIKDYNWAGLWTEITNTAVKGWDALPKAFNKIRPALKKIWKKVTGEATKAWAKLSDLGSKIGSWILGYNWSGLWASVTALALQGWDRLQGLGSDIAGGIRGYDWAGLWSRIIDVAGQGWDALKGLGSKVGGWIKDYDWAGLWTEITNTAVKGWDALKELGSTLATWIKQIDWGGVWDRITGIADRAWESLKELGADIKSKIEAIEWGSVWENVKDKASGAWTYLKGLGAGIKDKIENVEWGAVWTKIKTAATTAWDSLKELGGDIKKDIEAINWVSIWDKIETASDTAWDLLKRLGEDIKAGIEAVEWGSIWDAVALSAKTGFDTLVGLGDSIAEKLQDETAKGTFEEAGRKIGGWIHDGLVSIFGTNAEGKSFSGRLIDACIKVGEWLIAGGAAAGSFLEGFFEAVTGWEPTWPDWMTDPQGPGWYQTLRSTWPGGDSSTNDPFSQANVDLSRQYGGDTGGRKGIYGNPDWLGIFIDESIIESLVGADFLKQGWSIHDFPSGSSDLRPNLQTTLPSNYTGLDNSIDTLSTTTNNLDSTVGNLDNSLFNTGYYIDQYGTVINQAMLNAKTADEQAQCRAATIDEALQGVGSIIDGVGAMTGPAADLLRAAGLDFWTTSTDASALASGLTTGSADYLAALLASTGDSTGEALGRGGADAQQRLGLGGASLQRLAGLGGREAQSFMALGGQASGRFAELGGAAAQALMGAGGLSVEEKLNLGGLLAAAWLNLGGQTAAEYLWQGGDTAAAYMLVGGDIFARYAILAGEDFSDEVEMGASRGKDTFISGIKSAALTFKSGAISAASALVSGGSSAASYLRSGGSSAASSIVSAGYAFYSAVSSAASRLAYMGSYSAFAEGGIVRKPTFALIGEAGPEAIIPLKDVLKFAEGGLILPGGGEGGDATLTVSANFEGLVGGVQDTFSDLADYVALTWGAVYSSTSLWWYKIRDELLWYFGDIKDETVAACSLIKNSFISTWTNIEEDVATSWARIYSAYLSELTRLNDGTIDTFTLLTETIADSWDVMAADMVYRWSTASQDVMASLEAFRADWDNEWGLMVSTTNSSVDSIVSKITEAINACRTLSSTSCSAGSYGSCGGGSSWGGMCGELGGPMHGFNDLIYTPPGGSPININPMTFQANAPYLAEGGIVSKPTLAIIGENGPEKVTPLGKEDGVGVCNITVLLDGKAITRAVGVRMQKEIRVHAKCALR